MLEKEINTKKEVLKEKSNNKRINELRHWFIYEYPSRLNDVQACRYFKITPMESLDSLQLEWYANKQELNSLLGLAPLDEIQRINLFEGGTE